MKLQRTEARGNDIGRRAVLAATERIVRSASLPADVAIAASEGGVTITGKRLRRRIISDPALRNFAHE
jgi:hypothetical protein